MAAESDRAQRGIQSIEVGGQLLRALVHHGRPMALKDLAREAEMSAAKAHPYMVSFGRLGLIEQDRTTGHYLLGPLALQLGLISLQQANPVHIATPLIAELAQQIGHTVAIAVWGDRGATIVRIAESPAPLHVNMRHGTVFSMAGTASGRLFAAYLPAEAVREVYDAERKEAKGAALPTWRAFAAGLNEVRRDELSRSEGGVVAGVSALSAPVFDHQGRIVLALTLIGPSASFDSRLDGAAARELLAAARQASLRLGHRPAHRPP